ncbi:MAG: UTP--glucose-1-phosphate uridylyltransferase [Candidatus Paceibacteria bacterium]
MSIDKQEVTKGVITAAGLGTRFLPATKALPKELLPVMGKPVLQYTVEEMAESGIEDILIVISQGKEEIADYFERDYDYEEYLEKEGKLDRMESLIEVCKQVNFYYTRQDKLLGNGHALLEARSFIGDDPFAFADGDSIIDAEEPVVGQVLNAYQEQGESVIGVSKLEDREEMTKYGNVYAEETDQERVYKVNKMVEKPPVEETSDQRLVVGGMRYIFNNKIWEYLESQDVGKDGEIWVSDAADRMLNDNTPFFAYEYQGEYFDTGNPEAMFEAEKNFRGK